MGYYQAGFDVTGIDHKPQRNYPFKFLELDIVNDLVDTTCFHAIHASPPCQAFSAATPNKQNHVNLIPYIRDLLNLSGLVWVIENVVSAPLINPIKLCGTQFGLGVFRHRIFESNTHLTQPKHDKHKGRIGDGKYYSVTGWGGLVKGVRRSYVDNNTKAWGKAMGIDWMCRDELTQSIPPAYTKYIGQQLKSALSVFGFD